MPLFRKRGEDFGDELDRVITDLGLHAERRRGTRFTTLADGTLLFLRYHGEDELLTGFAATGDRHDPEGLNELLAANLEPTLVWSALGESDEPSMGIRFRVPFEAFDRDATLLAIAAAARRLGDATVAARAMELRTPADPERTRAALGDHGSRVETIVSEDGEVVVFRRELAYDAGPRDVAMQRWLLMLSDYGGARLGLTPIPGQRAYAVAAVPGAHLQPDTVEWGVDQVLRLAEAYDRR